MALPFVSAELRLFDTRLMIYGHYDELLCRKEMSMKADQPAKTKKLKVRGQGLDSDEESGKCRIQMAKRP